MFSTLDRTGLFLCTLALSISFCGGPTVQAQGVRIVPKQRQAGNENAQNKEEQIRAALDSRLDLSVVGEDLSEFLQQVEDALQFDVELDTKALDVVGIGGDTPITAELSDISLRSALRIVLRDLELTYMISDEVLLITTQEEADASLVVRVYEVGDLVVPEQVPSPVVNPYYGSGVVAADFDSLIELITTTIAPDRWDEGTGSGSVCGMQFGDKFVIVLPQTEDVHDQIEDLLKKLRGAKPRRVDAKVRKNEQEAKKILVKLYPVNERFSEKVGELAELLRESVAVGTWQESEGTVVIGKANTILVKHRRDVHEQVIQVLRGLGAFGRGSGGGFGGPATSGGILSVHPSVLSGTAKKSSPGMSPKLLKTRKQPR